MVAMKGNFSKGVTFASCHLRFLYQDICTILNFRFRVSVSLNSHARLVQSIARFRFLKYKIKCYTSCQEIRDQDHYCFFWGGGIKHVRRQTIFFVVVCANCFFQCFFFFDCIILLTTYFLSPVGDLR